MMSISPPSKDAAPAAGFRFGSFEHPPSSAPAPIVGFTPVSAPVTNAQGPQTLPLAAPSQNPFAGSTGGPAAFGASSSVFTFGATPSQPAFAFGAKPEAGSLASAGTTPAQGQGFGVPKGPVPNPFGPAVPGGTGVTQPASSAPVTFANGPGASGGAPFGAFTAGPAATTPAPSFGAANGFSAALAPATPGGFMFGAGSTPAFGSGSGATLSSPLTGSTNPFAFGAASGSSAAPSLGHFGPKPVQGTPAASPMFGAQPGFGAGLAANVPMAAGAPFNANAPFGTTHTAPAFAEGAFGAGGLGAGPLGGLPPFAAGVGGGGMTMGTAPDASGAPMARRKVKTKRLAAKRP